MVYPPVMCAESFETIPLSIFEDAPNARPIIWNGVEVGRSFENEAGEFCVAGRLRPRDLRQSRRAQSDEVFGQIEGILAKAGMDFSHVVRTWFYLDRILDWYDEFNASRNACFSRIGVTPACMPASTGIGAPNAHGAALVAGFLALKPKRADVTVRPLPSPLQCPAVDYSSSFSRAVEMTLPGVRHVLVSGTASIDTDGATIHIDDVKGQIAHTMNVVRAILESRAMSWADVTRAVAYITSLENAPLYDDYCSRHGLPAFPVAIAEADICRDDLLFEIEVDAQAAA